MSALARILITTDYLRPGDEVDDLLRSRGHETRYPSGDLVADLAGAEGALVGHDALTVEVLASTDRLRAVVRTGVGYDAVDVEAAARAGITVSNLPGINANAVAEYTMGLLLASSRRLVETATGVASGGWPRQDGRELRGSTLGLIGYGAAARAVVPLARAFGMRVLCITAVPEAERTDPEVRFVELPELLAGADHVSVHTALTPRTRGLLDAAAFALMKPGAVLVNTARSAILDEDALVAAVREGRIAGAALDVVAEEPLPAGSPLRGVPGIVVHSHLAGQTAQARRAAGVEGARELLDALAGCPKHAVNAHLIEKRDNR
ncbi:NAD(P)-dependent oxidoreductase [Nocardioides sp. NPDC047086]|uniref:NAD(P)-dependent oxidoreductase n=1 Tax=Nocardioides sp. NPDC047086 TaxID=3154810 RepID=UPI0033DEE6E5